MNPDTLQKHRTGLLSAIELKGDAHEELISSTQHIRGRAQLEASASFRTLHCPNMFEEDVGFGGPKDLNPHKPKAPLNPKP